MTFAEATQNTHNVQVSRNPPVTGGPNQIQVRLCPRRGFYPIPFGTAGQEPNFNQPHGSNQDYYQGSYGILQNVGSRSGKAFGLSQCAGVIYLYMIGPAVNAVGVQHSFSGDIPAELGPLGARFARQAWNPNNILVAFASARDIPTWGQGLFTIVDQGVPLQNIVVFEDVGGQFGANCGGEFGSGPRETWVNGNLRQVLGQAIIQANTNYQGQFPPNTNTLGLFGSGHNKTTGAQRIQTLRNNLQQAISDGGLLDAIQAFLTGQHSFKPGSLKLMLVQALYANINTGIQGAITDQNAQQRGTQLLAGIRNGTI
jgi:hypothetical protein